MLVIRSLHMCNGLGPLPHTKNCCFSEATCKIKRYSLEHGLNFSEGLKIFRRSQLNKQDPLEQKSNKCLLAVP